MAAIKWGTRVLGANIALTGSDLIATRTTGANTNELVVATPGASGLKYLEAAIAFSGGSAVCGFGLVSASIGTADTTADPIYCGIQVYPGLTPNTTHIYHLGTNDAFVQVGGLGSTPSSGARVGMAWNDTHVWFTLNGTLWNNNGAADPVTGVGGFAHAIPGQIYVMARTHFTGHAVTLYPTSAGWSFSAPSGFTEPVEASITPTTDPERWGASWLGASMRLSESQRAVIEATSVTDEIIKSPPLVTAPTYVEAIVSWRYTSAASQVGVGLSNYTKTTAGFLGNDANAVGYYPILSGGPIYKNNGVVQSIGTGVSGGRVRIAFTSTKIWFAAGAGQWMGNNATNDPETGLGGYTHGLTGVLYLAARTIFRHDYVELVPAADNDYSTPVGFSAPVEAPTEVRVTFTATEVQFPWEPTTPDVRVTFAAAEVHFPWNVLTPDVRVTYTAIEVLHSLTVKRRQTGVIN